MNEASSLPGACGVVVHEAVGGRSEDELRQRCVPRSARLTGKAEGGGCRDKV